MKIDRTKFFDTYRTCFPAFLTQKQVDGYTALFDYWESLSLTDTRWLAYVLATGFHETGELMQPVREGFCDTDQGSIQAVTSLYNQGIISENYAILKSNGNSYFGRGLVQITFDYNYEKLGEAIGIGTQLYENPSLALDLKLSVKIIFKGMIDGLFTGYSLADFLNATTTDWIQARRIINGMDKAEAIADYAQDFWACLS